MKLTIDSREQRSGIIELVEANPNINFEVRNLKRGDYIIEDSIVFECKTLPDFLMSIKEGRFFRQSYREIKRTLPYILILEGVKSDIQQSAMKREAVQGALVHIALILGIPALRSQNIDETLQLMLMTGKQWLKNNGKKGLYRVYKPNIKPEKFRYRKLKLQILQNLPGVGFKRAVDLLDEFGTLRNVFLANDIDLEEVKGVGNKTAKEIVKLLDG